MGLLEFNPVDWYESAKNGGLERKAADALVSSVFSAVISGLWSLGQKKFFGFLAVSATAMYLTLTRMESKNFLTLTVPKDMLTAENKSNFIAEEVTR